MFCVGLFRRSRPVRRSAWILQPAGQVHTIRTSVCVYLCIRKKVCVCERVYFLYSDPQPGFVFPQLSHPCQMNWMRLKFTAARPSQALSWPPTPLRYSHYFTVFTTTSGPTSDGSPPCEVLVSVVYALCPDWIPKQ